MSSRRRSVEPLSPSEVYSDRYNTHLRMSSFGGFSIFPGEDIHAQEKQSDLQCLECIANARGWFMVCIHWWRTKHRDLELST